MLAQTFAQFGRLTFPTAVVTDRFGNIFVAFADGDPVVKLNRCGKQLSVLRLPEDVGVVEEMSITAGGRLCIAGSDPPMLVVIDAHTARSAVVPLPAGVSPTAVTVCGGSRIILGASVMPFLLRVDTLHDDAVSHIPL